MSPSGGNDDDSGADPVAQRGAAGDRLASDGTGVATGRSPQGIGRVPRRRLSPRDLARVSTIGLRLRPLRSALSALGIAIGIASLVAVLGISRSSQAELLDQLDRLGTNLLQVTASQGLGSTAAKLPDTSERATSRIGPVTQVSAVADLDEPVLRSRYVDRARTDGITLKAARLDLLDVIGGSVADGRFLTAATNRYPVVVLGSVAAQRLGITRVRPGLTIWIDDQDFAVVGVLGAQPLARDIERSALIGFPIARSAFGEAKEPTTLYVRSDVDRVAAVRSVLPGTTSPEHPEDVQVTRPSDALEARAAAQGAFTSLLIGVGAVALLVGGIGIANVLVIGVLERRGEIGLRRALGATRAHVRVQFLAESIVLSFLGGLLGVLGGVLITVAVSTARDLPVVVPASAVVGGALATVVVGGIAGLYPAMRAASLPPTDALRSA